MRMGYRPAKRVIESRGFELHTLPGEKIYEGFGKYKRHYLNNRGEIQRMPHSRLLKCLKTFTLKKYRNKNKGGVLNVADQNMMKRLFSFFEGE